eukprot:13434371-Alexandrium_andersonii.AAC.1
MPEARGRVARLRSMQPGWRAWLHRRRFLPLCMAAREGCRSQVWPVGPVAPGRPGAFRAPTASPS